MPFELRIVSYELAQRLHLGEDIFEAGVHTGKSSDRIIDFEILTERTLLRFDSVRTLARRLKIPRYKSRDDLQEGPFVVKH
jgi:hypothetical protein